MGTSDVKSIIEKIERLLSEEELSEKTELAIQELLNVVECPGPPIFGLRPLEETR